MGDTKTPDLVTTADGKVRAYDRLGNKITVDKADVGKLFHLGGRVATRAEMDEHDAVERKAAAEKAEQARYDKLPALAKVGGAIGTVAGAAAGPLSMLGGAAMAPSQSLRAASHGVAEGLSFGASDAAGRKLADAVGGKAAGDKYAQAVDDIKAASPIAHGAGEALGMIGGAVLSGGAGSAAKALPAAGVTAAGEAVEAGVSAAGRALGYTGRTALGRAAMTAAELGVRGAAEGGLGAAIQYGNDAILHDVDASADKLFAAIGTGALYGSAGGAALGATGSLLKSGVRAAGSAIAERAGGALARVLAPAEEAGAMRAATEAVASGEPMAASVNNRVRKLSNEMAADALGATKTQTTSALEHVAGGKAAVGEYVNRIGIAKAAEGASGVVNGAWKAGLAGRADDLLAAIQADKGGRIVAGLSEAVKGTPARVDLNELTTHALESHAAMLKDPTKIAGADAFISRIKLESQALFNAGKVAADGTIDAADAFYTRSAMARQAYELGKASGAAGDAYKAYLRKMDDMTIKAIDDAAAKLGKSGEGDKIRYWKREYQLASAAEEMALKGAERVSGNNIFGIRESIGAATALASGHVLGGAATLLGGKIARERGAAVAAYGLAQLAERGTLTKWVQKMDGQIAAASKGLTAEPIKGALKAADRVPPTKGLAKTALLRVAEFRADPEAFIDKATRQSEALATHSPEIASGIVSRQVQAAAFLASKVPQSPDPDPMDPHPAPRLTPTEQHEFGLYAYYTEKPERFFSEVARGKLTFEGAETAKALMPKAFEQLQQQTAEHVASMMAKGDTIPYRRRVLLGVLMDFAATPDQRPDMGRFLQKNLEPLPSQKPPSAGGDMSAIAAATPSTAYDRLEAGGPGR